MGSLMAGWDSPVPHPNLEKYRRSKSLTKEEIEAYWKSKKLKEEEHLRDISLLSPPTQKRIFEEEGGIIRRKSGEEGATSTTTTTAAADPLLPTTQTDLLRDKNLEKLIQKNGWWISSNWAFLNEPPVIATEGTRQKYASQFHVPGSGRTGINASST